MITTSEKATQKSITLPTLSVHHTSFFLWASFACQARRVVDPLVGANEHQYLHELLEDDSLGDARAVTSERMVGAVLGQKGRKLLPVGFDEVRWECWHGAYSFCSGSVENSPHDGTSRARFSCDLDPY